MATVDIERLNNMLTHASLLQRTLLKTTQYPIDAITALSISSWIGDAGEVKP